MNVPESARLASRLSRAADLAFGLVAALGAVTLWGWSLNFARLRDFGADFPPMPPGASLGFVLLAAAFFAAQGATPRERRAALAAAALAGVLALLALFEDLFELRLGPDFSMSPAAAV